MIADLDVVGASPMRLEYDIAIVGGGPSGITLALELAGSGQRVVLLEGGARALTPESRARYEGPLTVGEGIEYPPLEVLRLRQFGGSTNHWAGWTRPLEANIFDARPELGFPAWPFERSELDFARAHELVENGRVEYDAPTLCAATGTPLPISETDVLQTPVWRLSPPTLFGDRYADALEASDVDVFLGANCVAFEAEGDRIARVRLINESRVEHEVVADRFVLACGTIETIRQLLVLQSTSAPDLDRSGLLGRGFFENPLRRAGFVYVDEPLTRGDEGSLLYPMYRFGDDSDGTPFKIGLALQPDVQAELGVANVAFNLFQWGDEPTPDELRFGPAVAALMSAGSGESVDTLGINMGSEQRFNPDSRITLSNERDDLGVPRPHLDWRLMHDDVDAIEISRRLVAEELIKQGFGPVVANRLDPPQLPFAGAAHHAGGARMHESPDLGVVNANQRCHGLANLYVAGGAVFPSTGAANPTLTIVAMAVRLAEIVRNGT